MSANLPADFPAVVQEDQKRQIKEERFRIILLGLLLVFTLGYMTWIYTSIRQFDAEALTRIAALKIEGEIPDLKKQFRQVALEQAESITENLKQLLLQAPKELRVRLLEESKMHAHSGAEALGKQLSEELARSLRDKADQMYVKSPTPMSQDERLDHLIGQIRKNFVTVADAQIAQHQGAFMQDLADLRRKLERYRTDPMLEPKDEIARDIIAITVIYVTKHHRLIEHDDGTRAWAEKQARAAAQKAAAVKEAAKEPAKEPERVPAKDPVPQPEAKTAAME